MKQEKNEEWRQRKELETALAKEWIKIPLETIRISYESIPCKIEAIIAAKGGSTPYYSLFQFLTGFY